MTTTRFLFVFVCFIHTARLVADWYQITIDGETELSFTEDVCKRYEAYGWHTQTLASGDSGAAAVNKYYLPYFSTLHVLIWCWLSSS